MKLRPILAAAALFCGFANLLALGADDLPGVGVQPESYFYTGKPYDKDLEAYTFAFRNYDPKLSRWTSADPSGFPDGANNNIYLQNNATYTVDGNGLWRIKLVASDPTLDDFVVDHSHWNADYALRTGITLDPGLKVNEIASSVSAKGSADAEYGTRLGAPQVSQVLPNLAFNVTVDSSGNLTVTGFGTSDKHSDGLALGVVTTQTGQGTRALTVSYTVGAVMRPSVFSGGEVNFANQKLSWESKGLSLRGTISFGFQAVE